MTLRFGFGNYDGTAWDANWTSLGGAPIASINAQ